ncbi:MAG: hypothetical protein LAP87_23385 [Acidobacteriia bacterium]|nr:hypothetical protein [Terriglobia bacterium]
MNAYQQLPRQGTNWEVRTGLLYPPIQAVPRWAEPRQRSPIFEGGDKQWAEFAAQHEAVLNEVRRLYVMAADSSVATFLTEHRALPSILLEAAPQLRACFGTKAVLTLRVPIDDSGSQTLYAVAMWPGNVRDVRNALEKFDETWWIKHSLLASGYLTLTEPSQFDRSDAGMSFVFNKNTPKVSTTF